MEDNSNLLAVSEREAFITNYKATYQAMTAKHDCKSKIFSRNVKVKFEDIADLNDRVTDKLKNYNDAGFSISVNASFTGRNSVEFSTWQEFENHKWNESNALNSITIIWEFNAILPNYDVPQKHVLVVKIADGLRPEEVLNIVFAGKLENIDDIEKQMYPVVARVDFINYVLGDELLHIVEEWDNGLELQDEVLNDGKTRKILKKHKRKIAFTLNYFTNFVVFICLLKIIANELSLFNVNTLAELTISNMCAILWLVGFSIIFFVFTDKLAEWLANIFFKTMDQEAEVHVFDLNKGDRIIQKKLQSEYNKSRILTISSIVGTFLVNLVCTVICSFIVK